MDVMIRSRVTSADSWYERDTDRAHHADRRREDARPKTSGDSCANHFEFFVETVLAKGKKPEHGVVKVKCTHCQE